MQALPTLRSVDIWEVNLSQLEEGDWVFSQGLTYIALSACELHSLPQALIQLTTRSVIRLAYNSEVTLVEGPYLRTLTEPVLDGNTLGGSCNLLRQATSLKLLKISRRSGWDLSEVQRLLPSGCVLIINDID